MPVFNAYSKYYDLLYKDKDYTGEAEYVHNLIQKHTPGAKSILNLGCGTGRHDFLLAEKGYTITGVDISEDMISIAKTHLSTLNLKPSTLSFKQSDIRTVRLNQTFDAVVSLFHVVSYQTRNEDLQATFSTVKTHLKPGGVFIFDCWYGPAVLTDRPSVRIKRLEDEKRSVIRIAEPIMHPNVNIVEVNYQIIVRNKASNELETHHEQHRVRYLFRPEIELFLSHAGFQLLSCREWMTERNPDFKSWSVCFVTKKSCS